MRAFEPQGGAKLTQRWSPSANHARQLDEVVMHTTRSWSSTEVKAGKPTLARRRQCDCG